MEMSKRRKYIIPITLLLIGVVFILFPMLKAHIEGNQIARDITEWRVMNETEELSTNNETLPEAQATETKLSSKSNQEDSTQTSSTVGMIGILTIPTIDLEIGIYDGASTSNLKKGAATVLEGDTPGQGNYSLAAHNAYVKGKQFNRLHELENGDKVIVEDKSGIYEYMIDETKIVHKSEVNILEDSPGKNQVTLMTCYPYHAKNPVQRFVAIGELQSYTPLTFHENGE